MVGDYFSKMAAAQKETPMQQNQSVQNGILTPTMAADAAQSQPKPAPQPAQPQMPIAQQVMQDASQVSALDPAAIQQQIAQLKLEIPQIRNEIQTEKLKPYEGIPLLKEKVATLKELEAQLVSQLQQPVGINALPAQQSGVAALPSGINEESFAGGGIVAFSGKNSDGSQGDSLVDMDYINSIGRDHKPVERSMWDSISDYYASPSSSEGVKRNIINTLNALGPVSASGQASTYGRGIIGKGLNYLSDIPAVFGLTNLPSAKLPPTAPKQIVAAPAPTAPVARPASVVVRPPVTPDSQYIAQDQQEGYASTPVSEQAAPVVQQATSPAESAYEKVLQESKQSAAEDLDRSKWLRIMEAGFGMLGGTSPYFGANVGQGVMPAIKGYAADVAANRKDEAERIRLMLTLGMKKEEMAQALGLKTRELDQELKKLGITEELYKHHGNYYEAMAAKAKTAGVGGGGASTKMDIAKLNAIKSTFATLQKSAGDMTSSNYGKSPEELWSMAESMVTGQSNTGPATNTVQWSTLGKK